MPEILGYQFDRVIPQPIETNRQVATLTARNAIPSSKRWEGMQVYVVADRTTYELNGGILNANWIEKGGVDDTATHYLGNFDATLNDPNLDNTTGSLGDEYKVVNGNLSFDFGSGSKYLGTGDIIIFDGNEWIVKVSANNLTSNKPPYQLATDGQTEILIDESADNVDVWVNQVMQLETIDYNRLAGVVTMTYALSENDSIVHRTYTSESVKEIFTATEGQTTVTLTSNPRNVDVIKNRVIQTETLDYTKSNNIITFTEALSNMDYIIVRKYR
jgi:hypothetical protein